MKVFFDIQFNRTSNLTLIYQTFDDSVNFIAHTCNEENHFLLMKETSVTSKKLHQLSTPFKVNFEVCLKGSLAHWFKCI